MGLLLVIVFWGLGPSFTKAITVTPPLAAFARFGVSIPLLMVLVYVRGGRMTAALFRRTALPGLAFGVNLMFVFAALAEVTVAILAVVVALQPALLLVLAGPVLNERPTRAHAAWTLVGVAAVAGVILGSGGEVGASAVGVLLALMALLSFTVYFVLTRIARAGDDVDPIQWMAGVNVWAWAAAIPVVMAMVRGDELAEFGGRDLLWILALGWITGVMGHVLMSWVHGYIEASRSSLYLLGWNVVAVFVAWPAHGETVTLLQVVCGAVVLIAVAAVIRIPAASAPAST